jgi:hypothetical protein
MSTPPMQAAVVSPAIAKWQYVEEKMRAVLDAFSHREVRPVDLRGGDDVLDKLIAALRAQPAPMAPGQLLRGHCFGPTFTEAGRPGVRRQLAVAALGPETASSVAEMVQLALSLLRESDLPPKQLALHLTEAGGPLSKALDSSMEPPGSVERLLREIGENVRSEIEAATVALATRFRLTAQGSKETTPVEVGRGGVVAIGTGTGEDPEHACAVGFVIDLHVVMGRLSDDDAGYEPAVSVIVAPADQTSMGSAMLVAARLRRNGIRTDLRHESVPLEHLEGPASDAGVRLVVSVAKHLQGRPMLTLANLVTGSHATADLDELDRTVALLLD